MDRRVIVEVLDHRGQVSQRVAVSGESFTVGRSADNDVILDDPHADARHARIEWSGDPGGWVLSDLDSVNGTSVAGTRLLPGGTTRIAEHDAISVGTTTLRLVGAGTAAADAVVLHRRLLGDFRPGALKALAAVAAAIGLGMLLVHLSWYEPDPGVGLGMVAVLTALLLFAWGGIWAIGNRLFAGRFNFWSHTTIAAISTFVIALSVYCWGFLDLALPDSPVTLLSGSIAGLLMLALPLLAHIDVASRRSIRFKVTLTGAIVGGMFVLGLFVATIPGEQDAAIHAALGPIRPVPVSLISTRSADEFAQVLDELRATIEEAAGTAPHPQPADGR